MKLHSHPEPTREVRASRAESTRWITVTEGPTSLVVFLTKAEVQTLIEQLQAILAPAEEKAA